MLIAEDSPINQKVAAAMLSKLGYETDVVTNGVEALEALSRVTYSAVLMDCQMPQMDGYQATAEIRKQEGNSRHIPIIALTGEAFEGDNEKCLAAGMDDYLSKPVDFHLLDVLLTRWIRGGNRTDTASTSDPAPGLGAVLDPTKLAELQGFDLGLGRDAFTEWTEIFFEALPSTLTSLQAAIDERDAQMVERVSHYLMGASVHIGATRITVFCKQLEALARSGALDEAPQLLKGLLRECERFRAAVRDVLKET